MKHPSHIDRFRSWLRRVFFWLPTKDHEEQLPDHGHDHALVAAVVATESTPRWRQLRYAVRILSQGEQRVFFVALLIFVASVLIAAGTLVRMRTLSVPVVGGTYTEALIGQPRYINSIDSLANDVDRDLSSLIYSGLFRRDGLEAKPDLAENYRWSDDHLTLTVKLREDARFQDGVPLTSEDVVFTFESILDPNRKSPLAALYRGVHVAASDAMNVTFQLDKTDVNLLDKLTVGILPAHAWQMVSSNNARLSELNLKPIGSGPYRVKSFLRDSVGNVKSYTLERFDLFYGLKPFIQTLVFQFYPDQPSALEAFRSELVDGIAFIPSSDVQKYKTSDKKRDIHLELPEETVAFFNVKDSLLSSKAVRDALALAVNRKELTDALHGDALALNGPFPFGEASTTEASLEQARNMLTEAGWVLAPNAAVRTLAPKVKAVTPTTSTKKKKTLRAAVSETTATPTSTIEATTVAQAPELTLTISVADTPDLGALAAVLQREWSLLGVRVTVEALPTDVLMRKATRERTTQVTLVNLLLTPDQDIFPFWWSGQSVEHGMNFSNLADRSIDDALEATHAASTTEMLFAARTQASSAILAQTPAIFLLRPVHHYLLSATVQGVPERVVIGIPSDRFASIGQWYLKKGLRWK